MRKHYNQMTYNEITAIKRRIHILKKFALSKYQITPHLILRMGERKIGFKRILKVFQSFEIVECSTENDDLRVTIKSNFVTQQNNNTLIIFSLLNGKLISCYEENKHRLKRVNLSKYNADIEITELLMQYIHTK